ncbi:hypothetical protein Bca4012_083320 [Brassica carinata]|uniref:MADS-box domain-containing protein n=1 Tax=Brassica carinata TaxID=52824 RepID=A0A8X7VAH3_BRACI|nr:hypothetical protein Bca52824_027441 [Brassica carinata]
MRPPLSSSSSSASSYSLAPTSLKSRLLAVFKKAQELTTLCDIEACVIHYGPDGELRTWPENRNKVRDLALRYIQLDKAKRRKKSVNLYEFLNKMKKTTKKTKMSKTKRAKKNVDELKYPISDHYSPDQINQLIQSLKLSYSTLQERRRFFLAAKANLEDRQHLGTQSLNPSQFIKYPQESVLKSQELCVYDQTNNFQHLCFSNTSDYSSAQESGLHYQLMPYGGYDQNMCMGNININEFQRNTQEYSVLPLELQESTSECSLNQLMQHELGFDQNMCMSDITNSFNVVDPCLSNMLPDDFCFDFRTLMVAIWSVTLTSLKIFQTCLQTMFMKTDYFRDLLYHLSSSPPFLTTTMRFL